MTSSSKLIVSPRKGKASDQIVKREEDYGLCLPKRHIKKSARKLRKPSGGYRLLAAMVTDTKPGDHIRMLMSIKKGLKFNSITQLEKALDISQKEIAQLLSITPSTFNRRKKEGHLHPDESDRVVRFARLKDASLTLMQGDDQAAISWLHTPLDILGGVSPLDYSITELGARDVEDLIGRLRHGVFS